MTEEKTASTSNEDGKMAEEIPSNEDGKMAEEIPSNEDGVITEEPEAHEEDDDTFARWTTESIFHTVTSGPAHELKDALSKLELGPYTNADAARIKLLNFAVAKVVATEVAAAAERNEHEGNATALAQPSDARVAAAQVPTAATDAAPTLEQTFEARFDARFAAMMALEKMALEPTALEKTALEHPAPEQKALEQTAEFFEARVAAGVAAELAALAEPRQTAQAATPPRSNERAIGILTNAGLESKNTSKRSNDITPCPTSQRRAIFLNNSLPPSLHLTPKGGRERLLRAANLIAGTGAGIQYLQRNPTAESVLDSAHDLLDEPTNPAWDAIETTVLFLAARRLLDQVALASTRQLLNPDISIDKAAAGLLNSAIEGQLQGNQGAPLLALDKVAALYNIAAAKTDVSPLALEADIAAFMRPKGQIGENTTLPQFLEMRDNDEAALLERVERSNSRLKPGETPITPGFSGQRRSILQRTIMDATGRDATGVSAVAIAQRLLTLHDEMQAITAGEETPTELRMAVQTIATNATRLAAAEAAQRPKAKPPPQQPPPVHPKQQPPQRIPPAPTQQKTQPKKQLRANAAILGFTEKCYNCNKVCGRRADKCRELGVPARCRWCNELVTDDHDPRECRLALNGDAPVGSPAYVGK